MRVRPIGGMVLVQRNRSEERTAGGLHIPEVARAERHRGLVLAVGPGHVADGVYRPMRDVRVGQTIIWDPMGAHDVPGEDGQALVSIEYVHGIVCPGPEAA